MEYMWSIESLFKARLYCNDRCKFDNAGSWISPFFSPKSLIFCDVIFAKLQCVWTSRETCTWNLGHFWLRVLYVWDWVSCKLFDVWLRNGVCTVLVSLPIAAVTFQTTVLSVTDVASCVAAEAMLLPWHILWCLTVTGDSLWSGSPVWFMWNSAVLSWVESSRKYGLAGNSISRHWGVVLLTTRMYCMKSLPHEWDNF